MFQRDLGQSSMVVLQVGSKMVGAGEVTEDLGELLDRPVPARQVRFPMLARALRALVAVRPQHVPDSFPHIQFEMKRSAMNLDG